MPSGGVSGGLKGGFAEGRGSCGLRVTLGGASLKVVQESDKEGLQGRCRCQGAFNRGIKGWLKGRDQGGGKGSA